MCVPPTFIQGVSIILISRSFLIITLGKFTYIVLFSGSEIRRYKL